MPASPTPSLLPASASPRPETEKTIIAGTVRIPIAKLDARLLQAEELLSIKNMTAHRVPALRSHRLARRLAKAMGQCLPRSARAMRRAREAAAVSPDRTSSPEALADFLEWNADFFRSLEAQLAGLAAQTEQDRHGAAKRIDELLEDSKKLLMLPFSTLAGVFPKVVRDLCRDQGKDAEIVILGGEVEIDNRILEEMKDGLLHILRNCVDHGVETPAERARLLKPPCATITLAVARVNGSKVEITVHDDGGGVDLERLRDSAVRHESFPAAKPRPRRGRNPRPRIPVRSLHQPDRHRHLRPRTGHDHRSGQSRKTRRPRLHRK